MTSQRNDPRTLAGSGSRLHIDVERFYKDVMLCNRSLLFRLAVAEYREVFVCIAPLNKE